jgi:hypothetical protein
MPSHLHIVLGSTPTRRLTSTSDRPSTPRSFALYFLGLVWTRQRSGATTALLVATTTGVLCRWCLDHNSRNVLIQYIIPFRCVYGTSYYRYAPRRGPNLSLRGSMVAILSTPVMQKCALRCPKREPFWTRRRSKPCARPLRHPSLARHTARRWSRENRFRT